MLDVVPGTGARQWTRRAAGVRASRPLPIGTIRILKFGGSSVATPDRIRDVAAIVLDAAEHSPIVVVVSAFHGVTNQLLECARRAARSDPHGELYESIAARHRACRDALICGDPSDVHREVDDDLRELDETLAGIARCGECDLPSLDAAASFGERLSARIVAAYLNGFRAARFVDARRLVKTDDSFTRAGVLFEPTNRAVRGELQRLWRRAPGAVPVVTGFIGATEDGRTTTIGRNGSDYTAAIVGGAVDAAAVEIWTDVDGVMSADPKVVRSASVLPHLTYEDARRLAHSGAKVVYPQAIEPAVARSIPILVKNSFNPSAPGTLISRAAAATSPSVTSTADLALVTLSAAGQRPLRSPAPRLFEALERGGIGVVFGSQASVDGTLCVAVRQQDAAAGVGAIETAFADEIGAGTATVHQRPDQAVVTIVGEGAGGPLETAGRALVSLARHAIAVRAIVPGASSRDTACVVDAADCARAIAVVHDAVRDTPATIALVVIGVGRVGSALLRELQARHGSLLTRGLSASVVAIADSRRCVVSADGIDLAGWRETLDGSDRPMDARALAHEVARLGASHAALVDCTAAPEIVDAYPAFVDAGFHIVTPNKIANVQPWHRYAALRNQLAARRRHFYDSTNVGAGLPILSTLRHLIDGGGAVSRIEGIVSGTLNYLFTSFDGRSPFSALVRDAHRLGLTEPDPRDDLSGKDVARKLLILARANGLPIDLDDVSVESLVPAPLGDAPFSEGFFDAFAAHDAGMRERVESARSRGCVLRYVGTLEDGRARAGVRELPADHPLASALGCDNVVAITSDRCERAPTVVRGSGAGADVTARSLIADLSALARRLRE